MDPHFVNSEKENIISCLCSYDGIQLEILKYFIEEKGVGFVESSFPLCKLACSKKYSFESIKYLIEKGVDTVRKNK